MNSLLRRYREVVFVGVFLTLPFFIYFLRDRKRWLDRGLIALTAPVEHGIVTLVGGITDAWGRYIWLVHTHEQDLELRREMLRERASLQLATEITAENTRLRGLLDLNEKSAPLKLLVAPVIAVGASPHSHTLRIARGTDDGIAPGAAVIAADGIVGTILQASGHYADVQLIVAPQAAVPAISARTRGRSTVRGTGDLTRCHLDFALRTDELAEGDQLITAGGSGFFPKGLKIGKVTDVQKRATGMFLGAEVIPSVDFSRLDEVLVVLQQPVDLAPTPVDPLLIPVASPSGSPQPPSTPPPTEPLMTPAEKHAIRGANDTGPAP